MYSLLSVDLLSLGSSVRVNSKLNYILIMSNHFDTLLRYVLSVTFCGAAVLKVMDQKTLVKRR